MVSAGMIMLLLAVSYLLTFAMMRRGRVTHDQLFFDRLTATQVRAGINHLVVDQKDRFTCDERTTLQTAQVILKEFVERTARDV